MQKVRICGENENLIRMWTLVILAVLIVAAALATVHLHRIADYKVDPTAVYILQFTTYCFRTSSILPKASLVG